MHTFRHCLLAIFSDRDLSKANGLPLYSYKLTEKEYLDLQACLQSSLRHHAISSYLTSLTRSDWAGAFVLYAAEWWRKQFSGGYWSWEPIFNSLGVNASDLTANQRNNLIASGFRYWRRPLLSNGQGRMFLGSVAVEGGLPLNLIADHKSRLANYFEQVIQDFGKFSSSQADAVAIAQAHNHLIAHSFRTDAVYTIIGEIAKTIFQLTENYALDEQDEPLRYLDAVAPNWLTMLPLNLEQKVAKQLLDGALGKAVEVQRRLPNTIRLQRRLSVASDQHAYLLDDPSQIKPQWKCQLLLSLRAKVNALYIEQLFTMQALPSRFSLFALGKKPLLIAKAFRPKNTPDSYLLDVISRALPSDWFDCEIQLMARSDEGNTWYAPLLGGGQLDASEPWLFHENDDQWLFYGAGDVSSEQSKGVLAINPDDKITTARSLDAEILLATSCAPTVRDLYLLDKPGCYTVNNYQVELGKAGGHVYEYVWRGGELPYPSNPSKCFVGKPHLVQLSAQGERAEITRHHLRWYEQSQQQWLPIETLPFGKSEVGYFEAGKLKKRFRLASLPEDLNIEIISGKWVNRGAIKISAAHLPLVTLAKQDAQAIDFNLVQSPGSVTVELFSQQEQPPAQVNLALWWQDKAKSISLCLPFPRKGICLYDVAGKQVHNRSELLVDNINSYELHGYGVEGEIVIDFVLRANDIERSFNRNAYFHINLDSVISLETGLSLSLFRDNIQALFALSSSLDAKIVVSVLNHGQSLFSFSLAAYSYQLQPDRNNVQVLLSGLKSDFSSCKLFTVPLAHPSQTPLVLIPSSTPPLENEMRWSFPDNEIEPGPWLIFCDDPKVGLRPLLWSKDLQLMPTATNRFEEASSIGSRRDRINAFSEVAGDMASDFDMTEWKQVKVLLNFEHLQLTTFDLWRGVTQSPEFLLALLLNTTNAEIERVWLIDKQFPVLWSALKISSSIKVINAFYHYLLGRLGDDMADVVQGRIQKKLEELVSFYPSLSYLSELLQFKIGLNKSKPAISVGDYVEQLAELKNRLSQRQTLTKWPGDFANAILHSVIAKTNAQLVSLCLTQDALFKNNVLNAPVLLALASSGKVDLMVTPELVHAMREYHRFDPEYFDSSFALTQKLIIGLSKV